MVTINKHVKAVIQLRRATEYEWNDYNPVLRVGEPALSTDVYKLKVGDGVNTWRQLPYLTGSGGGGTSDHRLLQYRNVPNQHPIEAITSLTEELNVRPNTIITDVEIELL